MKIYSSDSNSESESDNSEVEMMGGAYKRKSVMKKKVKRLKSRRMSKPMGGVLLGAGRKSKAMSKKRGGVLLGAGRKKRRASRKVKFGGDTNLLGRREFAPIRKAKRGGVLLGAGAKKARRARKVCNPWIEHVLNYAHKHNIGYGEAMQAAKASYEKLNNRKKYGGSKRKATKRKASRRLGGLDSYHDDTRKGHRVHRRY